MRSKSVERDILYDLCLDVGIHFSCYFAAHEEEILAQCGAVDFYVQRVAAYEDVSCV